MPAQVDFQLLRLKIRGALIGWSGNLMYNNLTK